MAPVAFDDVIGVAARRLQRLTEELE